MDVKQIFFIPKTTFEHWVLSQHLIEKLSSPNSQTYAFRPFVSVARPLTRRLSPCRSRRWLRRGRVAAGGGRVVAAARGARNPYAQDPPVMLASVLLLWLLFRLPLVRQLPLMPQWGSHATAAVGGLASRRRRWLCLRCARARPWRGAGVRARSDAHVAKGLRTRPTRMRGVESVDKFKQSTTRTFFT
jgi:hypothetical protein